MIRAVARLARAVWHLLRGVWTVWRHFSGASAAERHAHVATWANGLLNILGVAVHWHGAPLPSQGPMLLVANHVSWLDIIVLHAVCPQARFVSKAAVRHWPVIGRLTEAADSLFIERESKRDALRVVHHMAEALRAGDTVAVFPEGTTSDGRSVLPFHANLLQAAVVTAAPLQPLALRYTDAAGSPSLAAAYIGTTTLVQSLWAVVRASRLQVHVQPLPALDSGAADRRDLAKRLETGILSALDRLPLR